jgi:hypothetical protein
LKKPSDYAPEDGARFIVYFTKQRIQTKYLHLISDTEFKLIEDKSGRYVWTFGNVKENVKREVLKMIDEGIEQKSIADTLDIIKGYVSRIKKEAIEEGYLNKKGKLTL